MLRLARVLSLFLAAVVVTGCVPNAKPERMQPEVRSVESANRFASSIAVGEVTNRTDDSFFRPSLVKSADFKIALEAALSDAGFANPEGPLKLSADMIDVEYPRFGYSKNTTSTIVYTLVDEKGEIVLQEKVVAEYSPDRTLLNVLVYDDRLQRAHEGSARFNLAQFIDLLTVVGVIKADDAAETS